VKALLCKSLEGPESLTIEDIAEPVPQTGQVLIDVKAVSLNFFDTLVTRGKYQVKPELPFSPGGEVAGVVAGDASGFTAGQRVAAYVGVGGLRERVAVPAASVLPIPEGLPFEAAAALPIAYGTGLHALEDRGRLKQGDRLLVLGATGGTGLAAVEIGAALGATVIAGGTSDEKLKVCADHGAAHCLNIAEGDMKAALREITGGSGVDVVYDAIGGAYSEIALRSMAWGGRFLVIGFAAGDIPKIPLNLILLKECDVLGVFWGQHVARSPDAFRAQMSRLFGWCAEGKIRPHLERFEGLANAAHAISLLEKRQIKGKAVVMNL
jgi:NADPH2:quinone reductase